jgi:hypothetical protein
VDNSRVVFNIDDFCDKRVESIDGRIYFYKDFGIPYLQEVFALRRRYPNFKVTLFTVPDQSSRGFLESVKRFDWIEMAVHGFSHEYLDEMLDIPKDKMLDRFKQIDFSLFCKGFKAPGWRLDQKTIDVCNEMGLWVALHGKYEPFSLQCRHGYYVIGRRYAWWHAHTHNVENNWIKKDVQMLLERWPQDQEFLFVSEAIEKS